MHTGTDTQLGRWSQSTIPTDCCSDRKRRARARSTPAPLRHAPACSQPAGQPQRRRTGAQIARNTICTVLLGTWRGWVGVWKSTGKTCAPMQWTTAGACGVYTLFTGEVGLSVRDLHADFAAVRRWAGRQAQAGVGEY